jgi:hypothetical protein
MTTLFYFPSSFQVDPRTYMRGVSTDTFFFPLRAKPVATILLPPPHALLTTARPHGLLGPHIPVSKLSVSMGAGRCRHHMQPSGFMHPSKSKSSDLRLPQRRPILKRALHLSPKPTYPRTVSRLHSESRERSPPRWRPRGTTDPLECGCPEHWTGESRARFRSRRTLLVCSRSVGGA